MVAEKKFQKLDRIAAFNEYVEPCYYVFLLIAEICAALVSVLMIIHIFLAVALLVDKKTLNPFLNTFLLITEKSTVAFLAPVLFVIFGYYFFFCAKQG